MLPACDRDHHAAKPATVVSRLRDGYIFCDPVHSFLHKKPVGTDAGEVKAREVNPRDDVPRRSDI